ncbi:E2 [Equus caballus papillomavirus 4]|uniref:Regulatory protein E2 n=1 Tax=Equus caballus papillomavirus 4 TaxID=1235428 RepID=K9M929_9PAPI|nr:E2 [Equus caballus papillomavirus 4]AFS89105.1 E2 [Equus caballus papillomavirus 4]
MAKLLSHLDALSERQMTLLEKGSTSLACHLEYWGLQRRENMVMYAARQKGMCRVGHIPFPSMVSCAAKAREAIEMELQLASLLQTEFGNQPWTLAETSYELFKTKPRDTFKRGGYLAEVFFDGVPENAMWYPGWRAIIYEGADGEWHLGPGECDAQGLYFVRDGEKHYYTLFGDDAARFGTTGTWKVRCQDETYQYPSVSSTTDGDPEDAPDGAAGGPAASPRPAAGPAEPGSPVTGNAPAVPEEQPHLGGRRVASPGRRVHPPTRYQPTEYPSSLLGALGSPPLQTGPGWRGLGGVEPAASPGSPARQASPDSSPQPPPPQALPRAAESGPGGAAVLGNRGPAVEDGHVYLMLTGSAAKLKTWRWRLHKHHRRYFGRISSTFWWTTGSRNTGKCVDARVIITFRGSAMRETFLHRVSVPPGVTAEPFLA